MTSHGIDGISFEHWDLNCPSPLTRHSMRNNKVTSTEYLDIISRTPISAIQILLQSRVFETIYLLYNWFLHHDNEISLKWSMHWYRLIPLNGCTDCNVGSRVWFKAWDLRWHSKKVEAAIHIFLGIFFWEYSTSWQRVAIFSSCCSAFYFFLIGKIRPENDIIKAYSCDWCDGCSW